MARQKGLIKLRGTVAGLNFFKTKAYGEGVRAARGTYTEAKINDVFQANVKKAGINSKTGSPILKQLKALEPGFHSGDLWARMMRRMHKAGSTSSKDLLPSLEGMEINERYAFEKMFSAFPRLELRKKKGRLTIEMEILSPARFSKEVKASEYLCEGNVLFFNGRHIWVMDRMETDWISMDEGIGVYEMDFAIPKGSKYFLVVCGVKGGRGGKAIESFAARGYRVWEWGKI